MESEIAQATFWIEQQKETFSDFQKESLSCCSTYPVHDSAWLANCELEAVEAVRALRHHACLALWCGNNELEQGFVGDTWTATTMPWDQYKHLFDVLLKDVVEVSRCSSRRNLESIRGEERPKEVGFLIFRESNGSPHKLLTCPQYS